jgi:hypothetical protein
MRAGGLLPLLRAAFPNEEWEETALLGGIKAKRRKRSKRDSSTAK